MIAVAEVLAKARDVLAERGHYRGGFYAGGLAGGAYDGGAVCVDGALVLACGETDPVERPIANRATYEQAKRFIATAADLTSTTLWGWSDDTPYEDIQLALKHAEELALETV